MFDIGKLDMEGAQLAAITHGHSLGYMPAAVLVHIINRIVFPPKGSAMTLKEIILEARDTAAELFAGDPHLPELLAVISNAVEGGSRKRPSAFPCTAPFVIRVISRRGSSRL